MDMFAAEAVVELRKQHPEVILEMVSPFDDQASKWPEEYRARHDLLFELADITTATSHIYTKSAMFIRNRYLVNNADLFLCSMEQEGNMLLYSKVHPATITHEFEDPDVYRPYPAATEYHRTHRFHT